MRPSAATTSSTIPGRVLDLGTPVGTLGTIPAQLLGLRPGIPVAQGLGDAWAGRIGLGVLAPGSMALMPASHVLTGQSDTEIHGEGFFGAYSDAVMPGQYTVEGSWSRPVQCSSGSRTILQPTTPLLPRKSASIRTTSLTASSRETSDRVPTVLLLMVFPGQPRSVH